MKNGPILVLILGSICIFGCFSSWKTFNERVAAHTINYFDQLGPTMAAVRLRVSVPPYRASNVPVSVSLDLPESLSKHPLDKFDVFLYEEGTEEWSMVDGQLLTGSDGRPELWWILPEAAAGQKTTWIAGVIPTGDMQLSSKDFTWEDTPGDHQDLLFHGRKVIRYMYAFDPSTPERLHETYKPYHHVFDGDGEHLLTKGPGGLYTHHRGIFVGWNRLTFEGKEYDFWHMKGVVQKHERFLEQTPGPVAARSRYLIHWNYKENDPVIIEEREITVYCQPDPTIALVDFRMKLKAPRGDVSLQGDPEHAGFQYRLHNDIAEGDPKVKAKYLFHEDGVDPHEDSGLPWAAMTCVLNNRRYFVQHMNHPDNPEPTYSAYRDYGRFGACLKYGIKEGEVLTIRYRIHVAEGDAPPRISLNRKYSAFVQAPAVEVVAVEERKTPGTQ